MQVRFKTLAAISEKLIYSLLNESRSDSSSVVYHYTNAQGLIGILSTGRLWATDCRFLNDRGENKLGVSEATKVISEHISSRSSKFRQRLEASLPSFYASDEAEQNFVFSMSARGDDLAQWRMYANDGQGFTVGLDAEMLKEISRVQKSEFSFAPVSYNLRDFRKHILLATRLLETEVEALIAETPAGRETFIDAGITHLDGIVSFAAAMFKHSSFRSEREWRINTFVDEGDPHQEIKVRARGYQLVPYLDLDVCKVAKCDFPIVSVGIGPGFVDPSISYAVKRLCAQHNRNVELYVADTPFRRV